MTRSQVTDNERSLTFNVASQFINVELAESTLELAKQDLKSFQNTVDIGEARYKAGDIGEGDLLKIKLQTAPVPDRRLRGGARQGAGAVGSAPTAGI